MQTPATNRGLLVPACARLPTSPHACVDGPRGQAQALADLHQTRPLPESCAFPTWQAPLGGWRAVILFVKPILAKCPPASGREDGRAGRPGPAISPDWVGHSQPHPGWMQSATEPWDGGPLMATFLPSPGVNRGICVKHSVTF